MVVTGIAGILFTATPVAAESGRNTAGPQTEIIVAAAASLTDAMNENISLYQKQHPVIKVTPTYAASGTLRKQIEQGAPVDLFISANQQHMKALQVAGLIDTATLKNMFENKVVLIVPNDSTAGITSFGDCATGKVSRLAMGIPESVPAGDYAKQVFESLKIYGALSSKTVFAKDVRQVLTYVEQGEVDAGVVYATDAAISKKIKIVCQAPQGTHKPIVYPAAVILASTNKRAAKDFLDFLSTSDAEKIFAKYGFAVIK